MDKGKEPHADHNNPLYNARAMHILQSSIPCAVDILQTTVCNIWGQF